MANPMADQPRISRSILWQHVKLPRFKAKSFVVMPLLMMSLLLVATLVLSLSCPQVARGQLATELVFSEPDRQLRQRLDMAKDLVERERYSEAVQVLKTLLEASQDYLFQPGNKEQDATARTLAKFGSYKSLRTEARRLIAKLPSDARRAYELQFGETARRRLEVALTAGDWEAVADVPRMFPHTQASQQSLMLLGYDHMSRGRFLAAALCLEQVREVTGAESFDPTLSVMLWTCWNRSGKPTKAAEVFESLRGRDANAQLELAGKTFAIFDGEYMNGELESALEKQLPSRKIPVVDWTVVGGDASRTAASRGGRPLLFRPRWRQRIASDAATVEAIRDERQKLSDQVSSSVPAAYPLALRDLVLMRSPHRLVAVDFETGKRVWQIQDLDREGAAEGEASDVGSQLSSKIKNVRRRVWQDRTFGMLSSDGSTVFAIEPVAGSAVVASNSFQPDEAGSQVEIKNQLVAYDVAGSEGKRMWAVGGSRGLEPRLEDAFFLGPPLPLDNRLYVLAKQAGEIRLVVLNRKGEMQWSQQLAVVNNDTPFGFDRQMAGLSPSSAENILVCPTGVGAVVAVDLTTRDLLWGYRYSRRESANVYVNQPMFRRPGRHPYLDVQGESKELSVDDSATITEGHVLVTPSDSNALHCLDLGSGKLHWKREQGDKEAHLYVATVFGDQVIVVKNNGITAVDLLSSRPRDFSGVDLGAQASPSGRGFRAGDRYYLPVGGADGGALLTLDLRERKLIDRVATGNNSIPGNLICYRGQIVSLGTEYLERFDDLATLKETAEAKLAENAEDPWARTNLAETYAEAREHEEAVRELRIARRQFEEVLKTLPAADGQRDEVKANQLLARHLLFDSLLALLRADFEKNRSLVAETRPLIVTGEERISFLQIIADGLGRMGEVSPALDAYFDLIKATRDEDTLLRLNAAHSVRHSNWIRARLADLYVRLQSSAQGELQAKLDQELASLREEASAGKLFEMLRYYGDQPVGLQARELILADFADDLGLSDRIELLTYLIRNGDDEQRRRAVARLVNDYEQANLPLEAVHYCRRLLTEWPDETVLDGKTGKALVESLSPQGRTRKMIDSPIEWPTGAVKVQRRAGGHLNVLPVEILSRDEMHSDNLKLEFVAQSRAFRIELRDGMGTSHWKASLQQMNTRFNFQQGMSARLVGNRLFLSMGDGLVMFDRTAEDASRGTPVWRSVEESASENFSRRMQWSSSQNRTTVKDGARPWSDGDSRHGFRARQPRHALGPVTQGGVTHFRRRDLVSLDPASGDEVWIRHNLVPLERTNHIDLFGDEEAIVVAYRDDVSGSRNSAEQGDATKAIVLRSMDGTTLLKSARIPEPGRRWTTRGRMILEWRTTQGQDSLVLFDPWHQQDVWSHALTPGAKGALVGQDQVAILERSGRLRMFDIESGELKVEQQLAAEPQLRGLYVFRDRERYVVLANQRKDETVTRSSPSNQANNGAQFTGRFYTLDRETGEPLWAAPATLEEEWVLLDQPAELPVFVFCHLKSEGNSPKARVTFLDKRTGALAAPAIDVPKGRYGGLGNGVRVLADVEKKTVGVNINRGKFGVTATFSEGPRPPQPPAQMVHLDDESSVTKLLGKGIRLFGGAIPVKKE